MGKTALKTVSWLLLLIMVVITLHCIKESAHAMEVTFAGSGKGAVCNPVAQDSHPYPCLPTGQEDSHDDCNTCLSCACQGVLIHSLVQLRYNPLVLPHLYPETHQHLPEVFLSKFIPPQNLA